MSKILVIDDEEMNRTLLKIMISKFYGINVDVACNGQEGLKKYSTAKEQNPYRAVLTDLRMPRVPGTAVYLGIRKQHEDYTTPIVVVTGSGITENSIAYDMQTTDPPVDIGMLENDKRMNVLPKPINRKTLDDTINWVNNFS